MTQKAAVLPAPSPQALQATIALLTEARQQRQARIAWFEQQLFGRKSEKRLVDEPPHQGSLFAPAASRESAGETATITDECRKAKKQHDDSCVTDSGLRFGDQVPVQVIAVTPPELSGEDADQYEVIRTEVTHRLAQRPASYLVLRYERPVLKQKVTQTLTTPPAPANVLDNSVADVGLLAGLLVDKFVYH